MTLLRRPLWSLSVAALWLAIAGSLAWPALLTALALGLLLPALAGRWRPAGPGLARPWLLFPFALMVGWDVLRGAALAARLVLRPPAAWRPAWVRVPLALDRPGAVALLAGTVSLAPGMLAAELSPDGRWLLVHCLHAPEPEAVARTIRTRYEARIGRIFG